MSYKFFDCVWIEASAGSGKTQSIINHMMKLILLNVSTKKVVCFTLTNAAVNEISQRLVKEVRRVANMQYEEFKRYEVAINAFFIINGENVNGVCENVFEDVNDALNDVRNKDFYLFYSKSMEICENLIRSRLQEENLQEDTCDLMSLRNLRNGNSGDHAIPGNNSTSNYIDNNIFNIQTFHSFCLDLVTNSAKRKKDIVSKSDSYAEAAGGVASINDESEIVTSLVKIVTEGEKDKLVFDAKEKVMKYLFELSLGKNEYGRYEENKRKGHEVREEYEVVGRYGFFHQLKKFSSFYEGGDGNADRDDKDGDFGLENSFYFMNFIVSNLVEKKLLKFSSFGVSKRDIEHLMASLEKNHQSIVSLLKSYFRCDISKEMFSKNVSSLSNFLKYKDVFMTQKNTLRKKIEKICENDKEFAKEMNELMRLNSAIEKHKLQIKDVVEKVFLFYVNMEYSFAKKKINVLDFDDLTLHATNIVQNHESLANALEYMPYRYFLIDESQDISPTQWSIIYKIFEELRYVYVNDVCIYVVGDQKQSIYKFQGANKEDYDFYKQKILNVVKSTNGKVQEVNLNKCFRCDQKILNLVNEIFSQNNAFDLYEMHVSGKSDNKRDRSDRNNKGDKSNEGDKLDKVSDFEAGQDELNDDISGVCLFPVVNHENGQSMYELLAKKVACKVSELVNGGYANYSDIMILVKNRNVFLKEMVKTLKKSNIPFRGTSGENLYDNDVVFGFIHFAHFVWNSKNDFALMVVLRCLFSVNWSVLNFLSMQSKKLKISIWNYVVLLRNTLKNDLKFLENLLADSGYESDGVNSDVNENDGAKLMNLVRNFVYSDNVNLIQRIIRIVNYCEPKEFFTMLVSFWQNWKNEMDDIEEMGDVDCKIQDAFLNLVNKLPKYECFFDAIAELTEGCKSVVVDDNDFCDEKNALRILTVHKAKGLQSSIVFLPDTTSESSQRGSEFEMLYVALTRAQNALYVYGWGDEKGWYKVIKNALSKLN